MTSGKKRSSNQSKVDYVAQHPDQFSAEAQAVLPVNGADAEGKRFAQATGEAAVALLAKAEGHFFLYRGCNENRLSCRPFAREANSGFHAEQSIEGADVQIEFTRDAAGAVAGLVLQQSGQAMTGQKVK